MYRIVSKVWKRAGKFGLVGGIAAILQLATLSFLMHLFHNYQMEGILVAGIANTCAIAVGSQLNYFGNRLFTWKDRKIDQPLFRHMLSFYGMIAFTLLLNQAVFMTMVFLVPAYIAGAIGILAAATLNYFIQDRYLYVEPVYVQTEK